MKILSRFFIVLGISFILNALFMVLLNLYNETNAEKESSVVLDKMEDIIENKDISEGLASININDNNYVGTISINKFDLNLPICEDYSYDNLKISPCLYYGDFNSNNFVICAHAYAKHFKYIGNLEKGDIVILTDVKNETYYYKVELVEELTGTDVDQMLNSDFDLTLFTCSPSGLKRITVRCNRMDKTNI